MLHQGPDKKPKQGTKGGVAFILSEEFKEGWKQGGYTIKRGRLSIGKTTRYLEVQIELKLLVKHKT